LGTNRWVLPLALAAMFGGGSARAQAPADPAAGRSTAVIPVEPLQGDLVLAKNTLVTLTLVDEVSSNNSKPDDLFELRVADPVLVQGRIVIPSGARAVGQVIDAQKGGIFGHPAKLLIAIRFVELESRKIPMRFYQPSQGNDRTTQATVLALVPIAGLFAPFIRGGEIVLPPGVQLVAKAAEDTPMQLPPPTQPAAALAAPDPGTAP
jgi:hypothetical protein